MHSVWPRCRYPSTVKQICRPWIQPTARLRFGPTSTSCGMASSKAPMCWALQMPLGPQRRQFVRGTSRVATSPALVVGEPECLGQPALSWQLSLSWQSGWVQVWPLTRMPSGGRDCGWKVSSSVALRAGTTKVRKSVMRYYPTTPASGVSRVGEVMCSFAGHGGWSSPYSSSACRGYPWSADPLHGARRCLNNHRS